MKAVFSLITLRCLIRARVCALSLSVSQEELQPGLLTAGASEEEP